MITGTKVAALLKPILKVFLFVSVIIIVCIVVVVFILKGVYHTVFEEDDETNNSGW